MKKYVPLLRDLFPTILDDPIICIRLKVFVEHSGLKMEK